LRSVSESYPEQMVESGTWTGAGKARREPVAGPVRCCPGRPLIIFPSARVIAEYPDREQTMQDIKAVELELAELNAGTGGLEEKLQTRKKQFRLLVHGIRDIQRTFDEEVAAADAAAAAEAELTDGANADPMEV
jgi:hypothetical protein